MKWPTTLVLMSIIASTTALGWQGTIASDVVTTIYSAIVSGVLVGHYVKTSNAHNGNTQDSTTTIVRKTEPTETL